MRVPARQPPEKVETLPHLQVHVMDVEQAAQMLEKWAELRMGYLHGKEPTNAIEIQALTQYDLTIWAEAEGVRHAAQILRNPHATMSIPTWLEPQWQTYLESIGSPCLHPEDCVLGCDQSCWPAELREGNETAGGSCGRCGHPWDWHSQCEDGTCRGGYLAGLTVAPCQCRIEPLGKDPACPDAP
jgi:hypothetical protein